MPTVTKPGFNELQVTELVRSLVVPLEYIPVAINCREVAGPIVVADGVMVMEESVVVVPPPP